MVLSMFPYISSKLCYLDLGSVSEFAFKHSEHDLSLSRFQSITHTGDWPHSISHWEVNEFFIHEVA